MLALRAQTRLDTTSGVPDSLFTIGDVVRKLRDRRGWTQVQLAERAAVNKETIKNLEADPDSAQRRTIIRVCKALEITEADLYAYAEPVAMSARDREHWALWKRVEVEPDKAAILLGLAADYDEQRKARESQPRSEAAAAPSDPTDQSRTKARRG